MSLRLHFLFPFLFSISLFAQNGIVNGDFETGSTDSAPAPWFVPAAFQHYQVHWTKEQCAHGNGCVLLTPGETSGANPGNIMQMFDATPYRGKLIRFRAAVNTAAANATHAGLWLRVDRPSGGAGFFDNMSARPIVTAGQWQYFEINGFVHPDASQIALGILAYSGAVRFDDASLTVTGDLPPITEEPPRALTDAGLANITAFSRLYGIVRFFHPSDQAVVADWDMFAIAGVRKVESAASPAELASTLQSLFSPLAPTIRIYAGPEPPPNPALSPGTEVQVIRWRNTGFGQGAANNIYRRERVKEARTSLSDQDIYRIDLGRGVRAAVPVALFVDADRTLPHADSPPVSSGAIPASAFSANDRGTRMADVVIAWNILKHFYPYFDVVKTDWDAVWPETVRAAAADANGVAFHATLRRMIAKLNDGHGNVGFTGAPPLGRLPILANWIEGKLIVTATEEGTAAAAQLKPGDEIVAIDGKPTASVLSDLAQTISAATPQWKRYRSVNEALTGPPGRDSTLTVRTFRATETRQVTLSHGSSVLAGDPRPKDVTAELEPGIWYVDLTRAKDKQFEDVLPKLASAKGIVFDMRGYPSVSPAWFQYMSKTPLKSPQWHVPVLERPGQMSFIRQGEWNLDPKPPFIAAKKVFLVDGRDISYAESTMGIVENYKLGEIVGETTAGTNGNINPFPLPGGYTITWTGMKVLKNDGTQHHGVGIHPTIPAGRTQARVAAGRDEVLERGVAALK